MKLITLVRDPHSDKIFKPGTEVIKIRDRKQSNDSDRIVYLVESNGTQFYVYPDEVEE